jgi:hypothetical protein
MRILRHLLIAGLAATSSPDRFSPTMAEPIKRMKTLGLSCRPFL